MRDAIRGAALVFGVLAAVFSLLAALLLALLAVTLDGVPPLVTVTVLLSLVAVGVGLGAALAVAAWRSLQGRASPPLRLPPPWWLGLIFLGLLALGQLVLGTRLAGWFLPPLHVAVSLAPPLLLVAAITRPLQRAGAGLTRRDLAVQFAYGGLVAVALGILLEVVAALGVTVLAGVGVALLPGGAESVQRLAVQLQTGDPLADPLRLLRLLLSPGLVLGLGLLVAGVVPLLEEVIKSLGAWIDGVVQGGLTAGRAFAFGVMAGAGFSFTEALFYAAQLLPSGWAGGVVLRSLTVVVHAASTGLLALGWYEVAAGRPARFFPYAAGGIGIHALWNGLSGLAVLAGLRTLEAGLAVEVAGGGLAALAGVLLAVAWLAALAVLVYQTRRLSAGLSRGQEDASHAPR